MSVNKIDYDVLDQAAKVYANQAAGLDEIINTLVSTNSQLQAGWDNETARAFIERFESDHKVALQDVRDAIQEISEYIVKYVADQMDLDTRGAGAISGR